MLLLIKVQELNSKIHTSMNFVLLDLYLESKIEDDTKTVHLY